MCALICECMPERFSLQVGKEAESDGVLEGEGMPGDLKAAAEHIDGVMVSMRKVATLP